MLMPGMGGRELAERIRQRVPAARVLYTGEDLAARRAAEDGSEFLAKPFTPHELLMRVRTMLDG